MAVISTIVPVPAGVTSSNDVVVPGGQRSKWQAAGRSSARSMPKLA